MTEFGNEVSDRRSRTKEKTICGKKHYRLTAHVDRFSNIFNLMFHLLQKHLQKWPLKLSYNKFKMGKMCLFDVFNQVAMANEKKYVRTKFENQCAWVKRFLTLTLNQRKLFSSKVIKGFFISFLNFSLV